METKGRSPRAAGPVRITLPASIAYDPNALKKGIASIVERLGCPRCFSGADCFFQMERQFVLDPKVAAGPTPDPWLTSRPDPEPAHRFTVGLSSGVRHDLDKIYKAVDKVIDIIGAHPCISGFDFLFQDELRTIVVNEKIEAQRFDKAF
jgi:hypothetical protein